MFGLFFGRRWRNWGKRAANYWSYSWFLFIFGQEKSHDHEKESGSNYNTKDDGDNVLVGLYTVDVNFQNINNIVVDFTRHEHSLVVSYHNDDYF